MRKDLRKFDLCIPHSDASKFKSVLNKFINVDLSTVGDITNVSNFRDEELWRKAKAFYESQCLAQLLRISVSGEKSLYIWAEAKCLIDDEEDTVINIESSIPLLTNHTRRPSVKYPMPENYYKTLRWGPIASVGLWNVNYVVDRFQKNLGQLEPYHIYVTHGLIFKQEDGIQINILREPPTSLRIVEGECDMAHSKYSGKVDWLEGNP